MNDLHKLLHLVLMIVMVLLIALSVSVLLSGLGSAVLPLAAIAVLVFVAWALWPRR